MLVTQRTIMSWLGHIEENPERVLEGKILGECWRVGYWGIDETCWSKR